MKTPSNQATQGQATFKLIPAALVSFAFVFTLTNCDNGVNLMNSPVIVLGDTLEIAYRDTAFNEDRTIWVTFDSLAGDSRCPVDVVCVWQGNAEISFVFFNSEARRFSLNTFRDFGADTTVLGHRISLLGVQPHPHTDSLYSVEDYSVQVVVSR